MRKVPILFDPRIELAEIMRAVAVIDCTIRGNDRGELVITPNGGEAAAPLAKNVIPIKRGQPCEH